MREGHYYTAGNMDGWAVEPRLIQYIEHSTLTYQVAHDLYDIRDKRGLFQVLIQWGGIPDPRDGTLDPLPQVHEDFPGMAEDFLYSAGNREL